jgi:hypothetical protein
MKTKKLIVGWIRIIVALSIAVGPLVAYSQGKENAEHILKAYKVAHAKKDVSGLMALVLFQSGGVAEKANWRKDFEAETRVTVVTKIVPISTYAVLLGPEERKRIRPTIKMVSWLVVDHPPESKSSQRSGLYPIGIENGRAFIIGP